MVCDTFCCKGLANPGLSMKDKHQTFAFAFDHVVEIVVHSSVVFDQGFDKQLPGLWQQQCVKGVRVELHLTYHLNRKQTPPLIGEGEPWDIVVAY